MGVVYKAFDSVLKRELAVKTLLDVSDAEALELFRREYEVLAHINHPNIVEIIDIGEFEVEGAAKPYFIMPLLPGLSLAQLIKTASQRLTVERAVDIISQTCRGLHAAHEKGLVHRDVKPNNIIVLEDDSVKIIDFGMAHVAHSHSRTGLKGTLLYMAPEQIQMRPPSPLSDIFALGVVAYETLTRRRPFEGPTERDIVQAIEHYIPPPVSDLNPMVSPAVARVIHKAMAKRPYHRFQTARDFAETLQRAMRSEPIEIFEPSRIRPRLERAAKAFEQADYQFAAEILEELEAEGHIDHDMTVLRLKVDQAARQKRIQQLLESARTRMEGEEYPLALQKVQEALELDATHAGALSLRSEIEEKRNASRFEDWLSLARQHLANHSYDHAREALKNALQLKPKDNRVGQLLNEVDWQEQEYQRLYSEKQQLYQAAVEAWSRGEVSAAFSKIKHVLELEERAPDVSAPERAAAYVSLYNQVNAEHDAMNSAYAEARQSLAEGKLARALQICDRYLAKYPGNALFQAMKFDVEERQRQELSGRIAGIDRQVEAEPDLDQRVDILQEGLKLHPGEPHFQRALQWAREKRDLVNSIVAKARLLEERGQFADAVGQWEIIRTIHSQYPGLSLEIDRLGKRREQQARAEAKARWVKQTNQPMAAGDYDRALALLRQAGEEFPGDAELGELEKSIQQGKERAGEAVRTLAKGQELLAAGRVQEGLDALRRAHRQNEHNSAIRQALLEALVKRAQTVLETDWRAAESLLQEALELDPGHSLAKRLRSLVRERKRQELAQLHPTEARDGQAGGGLGEGAAPANEALTSSVLVDAGPSARGAVSEAPTVTMPLPHATTKLPEKPLPQPPGTPPVEPVPAQEAPARPRAGKMLLWIATGAAVLVVVVLSALFVRSVLRKRFAAKAPASAPMPIPQAAPAPAPPQPVTSPALTLSSGADRNAGNLLVVTGEDGATILLNGRKYAGTTKHGQLVIANLEPKRYTVAVIKDGFQPPPAQEVSIQKGQGAKLIFSLQPVPAVASLIVQTVAGAQILIDGRVFGQTGSDGRLEISSAPAGDHTVEVVAKPYDDFKEKVTLSPGRISRLTPSLLASMVVEHKHVVGSCNGTLTVGGGRVRYQTSSSKDSFDFPLTAVKKAGPADSGKGFYLEIAGAKRYVFLTPAAAEDLRLVLNVLPKQ
jgi:serine/threonine-protein kinase